MSLSLRQIRYFIATAETGQVTQAAMDLHISQSAITTAIKGLEETLGTNLFERKSHGVSLTYEGTRFLQHAKHIMSTVDEALRMPSRISSVVEGRVTIAISYTVAGYFLPVHLSRFSASFPKIEIQLIEVNRSRIEEGIINGASSIKITACFN